MSRAKKTAPVSQTVWIGTGSSAGELEDDLRDAFGKAMTAFGPCAEEAEAYKVTIHLPIEQILEKVFEIDGHVWTEAPHECDCAGGDCPKCGGTRIAPIPLGGYE